MSLLYELAKPIVRPDAKGTLEKAVKDPHAVIGRFKAMQEKPLPLEKLHKKYAFEEKKAGETVYYRIHPKKGVNEGIVLYFFGGYCMPGDAGDFEFGQDMADHTGMEVWLVWYPMFPDATGYAIAEAAADVYEEALKICPAQKISFYGNSSGGALCFAACVFLRKYRPEVPFPGKIASSSPALRIPPTPEEQKKMDEMDPLDVMIPARLAEMYSRHTEIFKDGGFEEFQSPIEQSWKGFPKTLVLFGTDEVFMAFLPSVIIKGHEDGVDLETYVGKGCHCFSAAGFLPESRPGRKKIYSFLKD